MNTNKIKGRAIERYGTLGKFYEKVGWSPNKAANIMSGRRDLNSTEIKIACDALDIDYASAWEYFF